MAVALVNEGGSVEAVAINADTMLVGIDEADLLAICKTISEGGHLVHVPIEQARIGYGRTLNVTVSSPTQEKGSG